VVERPLVSNRCINTHIIIIILDSNVVDKMETERSHLGGSVEHSEGKGGKSDVAIPRFLCGSPACVG
jgi:hypothetical protein